MPASIRAGSLLASSGRLERWVRSGALLFSKSFDPRGFMNGSILVDCFLDTWLLTFGKSDFPSPHSPSIGHATIFLEGFPWER